jgi:hypothetical protein
MFYNKNKKLTHFQIVSHKLCNSMHLCVYSRVVQKSNTGRRKNTWLNIVRIYWRIPFIRAAEIYEKHHKIEPDMRIEISLLYALSYLSEQDEPETY